MTKTYAKAGVMLLFTARGSQGKGPVEALAYCKLLVILNMFLSYFRLYSFRLYHYEPDL
ncbi:hypothetical protein SG34_005830 [Thalassomonas viridans]|uniref:Uncharacterized protein n=1 Tax=Thalassomonas viridans TaxID=137584 RepID=A0AAE9Z4G3_9GAMM|nr:hypothetical protein [Thalassomonas viridans]WDE06438.1 hypothetical protein SG34_005830 [Thalassomonas viridans]